MRTSPQFVGSEQRSFRSAGCGCLSREGCSSRLGYKTVLEPFDSHGSSVVWYLSYTPLSQIMYRVFLLLRAFIPEDPRRMEFLYPVLLHGI
jgi:hypothetical protein